ncbi:radical SAM protein [Methylophilaceae bacterium]|nr:radical SAM protein [Methylophilaceae bacterium]
MPNKLSAINHDRRIFKGKYIYPVVSRRADGLSIGINLNTNSACNWQCIYCEVPDLKRGKPEPIDLALLREELIYWLNQVIHHDFLGKHTEPGTLLRDIAFSGNGEPTAAKEFGEAIKIVMEQIENFKLKNKITIRLITNGSYLDRPSTQKAWEQLQNLNREIWFKIDAIDPVESKRINQINISTKSVISNLQSSIKISPTIIQTCILKINNELPSIQTINHYINFLKPFESNLKAIHLYSLARPTEQKSSDLIERLSNDELNSVADNIKQLKVPVLSFI